MNTHKILVLEEEIIIAEDIKDFLQNAGHEVERAFSLSDALEKASILRPDLVLIGKVSKEGQNEVEAAIQIESSSSIPLKFIFLVSKSLHLETQIQNYQILQKPFASQELLKIVNEQFQDG